MAAIANYTARVVDPTLDAEQTLEALLFIGASILYERAFPLDASCLHSE